METSSDLKSQFSLYKVGLITFVQNTEANVFWGGRRCKKTVTQARPDLLGAGLEMTLHTHTCVLAIELFEGTDEIRLVGKKLLPQDFEGRTLSSPNAGDGTITARLQNKK